MNDDTIQDLKQFIAATVHQEVSTVNERLDRVDERLDKVDVRLDKVDQRLDKVEVKIDDIAGAVAEAIENTNEVTDVQLKDHGKRIARLEQKVA
jgi:tetrahydromethanopterin S-methyltransferase subunit G